MPVVPDTQAVVTQLTTNLQGLTLNGGSTPAYNTVFLGGVKDLTIPPGQVTPVLPAAMIILGQDDSARHTSGGGIQDHTDIEIRSVVDYTDHSAAEVAIMAIRDALMPMLQKHSTLNNSPTVFHVAIKPASAKYSWMLLQPKTWYRIHTVTLVVVQSYILSGGVVN